MTHQDQSDLLHLIYFCIRMNCFVFSVLSLLGCFLKKMGPIPDMPTGEVRIHETTIGPLIHDFYRTDAVSRASVTMAKTSALHRESANTWEF